MGPEETLAQLRLKGLVSGDCNLIGARWETNGIILFVLIYVNHLATNSIDYILLVLTTLLFRIARVSNFPPNPATGWGSNCNFAQTPYGVSGSGVSRVPSVTFTQSLRRLRCASSGPFLSRSQQELSRCTSTIGVCDLAGLV